MEQRNDMSQLWRQARKYGLVTMHGMGDGTYSCNIKFKTPSHTNATASSGFRIKTPEEALEKATINAQKFIGEITDMEALPHDS